MPELDGFKDNFTSSLNDFDFTADPEAMKAKLVEMANGIAGTGVEGLLNKNHELLQKSNSTKETSHAASEKMKELQGFYDDSKIKESELTKDYQASKELYQASADKKVTAVNEEMDGLKGQLRELLVNDKVSSELVNLDVSKELMPMVQASIASLATIIDGKAMVGEESLSEYIVKWAETPAGKAVRVAPNNSGGDANGGSKNIQGSVPSENETPSQKRAREINERFNKV